MLLHKIRRRIAIERISGPLAPAYDKAARRVIDSYYSQVAEEIVSKLKSGKILDLGTGPGYLPIEIVKRAPSIKVNGIDLTPKFVEIARANAVKAGLADKLHFEVGNAAKLRFEDYSYDMVVSTGMLHSLKDPVKVIKECYRVLKPGGETWIYDPAKVVSGLSEIEVRKWKASLTPWERFLYKVFILFQPITCIEHYYTREEATKMISLTEFKDYLIEGEGEEIKIKLKK